MDDSSLSRIERLEADEKLFLMLDIGNEYDSNAVSLRTDTDRVMVGYVPRYLARDINRLTHDCGPAHVEVYVDRVNRDAPLRHRVLCRVRACWPEEFQPCLGDEFLPISSSVPERC